MPPLQKQPSNVTKEKADKKLLFGELIPATNCWPEARSVTPKWITSHHPQHKELIWTLAFCLTFAHVRNTLRHCPVWDCASAPLFG